MSILCFNGMCSCTSAILLTACVPVHMSLCLWPACVFVDMRQWLCVLVYMYVGEAVVDSVHSRVASSSVSWLAVGS